MSLSLDFTALVSAARDAATRSYSPYSKYAVGAALLAEDGRIFSGCNVENAAYGDTICAERAAVVKAVSEGRRRFTRIAIYGEGQGYCMPCGSCRQVLSEFSPEMEVLCAKAGGSYVSYPLTRLMPYTFKF